MFTGDFSLGAEVLVDVNERGCDDTEQQSESDDNGVTNPDREGGLSLGEKAGRSLIFQEGWENIIPVVKVDK